MIILPRVTTGRVAVKIIWTDDVLIGTWINIWHNMYD